MGYLVIFLSRHSRPHFHEGKLQRESSGSRFLDARLQSSGMTRYSRQSAVWLRNRLVKGRNHCMRKASVSEPMITVRPARPGINWCPSNLSFPQAKRVGNPSEKKDSGQAGMTDKRHCRALSAADRTLFRIGLRRAERPQRGRVNASNYWSSTTNANNPNNAWNVNFNNGNVNNNNKNNNNYVRCVRGGK